MKRKVIYATGFLLLAITLFAGHYWINTQPVWIADKRPVRFMADLPGKNKEIITFIEQRGAELAPNYQEAVCTEFVIQVIDHFGVLDKNQKNGVRIITNETLIDLIEQESPVIKGVQSALIEGNRGIIVENTEDVKPGDFVQFWNVYQGKAYGHCGIIREIEANKSITIYSSHPVTNGYGEQVFLWPDKIYFVRLK